MLIYKILRADEWQAFEAEGATEGAPIDVADGYIHFSTAEQLRETARKHFAGEKNLVLAAVAAEDLASLRWEPSRGGALFPHLYGKLSMDQVIWRCDLPIGPEGHIFPEEVA